MDNAFLKEFGIRSKELSNLEETERENAYAKLREVVKQMADYCKQARREGLLMLEEVAFGLEEESSGNVLAWMFRLIVDGFDPSHVEDMVLLRYFAQQRNTVEALTYLMQMYGSLMIQNGENNELVEAKLLAMLPAEAEEVYRRDRREEQEKEERERAEREKVKREQEAASKKTESAFGGLLSMEEINSLFRRDE